MNKNTQLAHSFLATMASDGLPVAMERHCSADFTYWMAGAGEIQEQAEAANAYFQSLIEEGSETLKIIGTTSENDRVAVEAETRAKLKTGKEYFNQYHYLFSIDGDKISSVRSYFDTGLAQSTLNPGA